MIKLACIQLNINLYINANSPRKNVFGCYKKKWVQFMSCIQRSEKGRKWLSGTNLRITPSVKTDAMHTRFRTPSPTFSLSLRSAHYEWLAAMGLLRYVMYQEWFFCSLRTPGAQLKIALWTIFTFSREVVSVCNVLLIPSLSDTSGSP